MASMTTQDGYDWPNGVGDERWPATKPKTVADLQDIVVTIDLAAQIPPLLPAPGIVPPFPRYWCTCANSARLP